MAFSENNHKVCPIEYNLLFGVDVGVIMIFLGVFDGFVGCGVHHTADGQGAHNCCNDLSFIMKLLLILLSTYFLKYIHVDNYMRYFSVLVGVSL